MMMILITSVPFHFYLWHKIDSSQSSIWDSFIVEEKVLCQFGSIGMSFVRGPCTANLHKWGLMSSYIRHTFQPVNWVIVGEIKFLQTTIREHSQKGVIHYM